MRKLNSIYIIGILFALLFNSEVWGLGIDGFESSPSRQTVMVLRGGNVFFIE